MSETESNFDDLSLFKSPFLTCKHFICEICHLTKRAQIWLSTHLLLGIFLFFSAILFLLVRLVDGPHLDHMKLVEDKFLWCGYWLVLGVLSSIGLGSGLHTFVLYLGPHIAKVTLAAYECGTLDFQEPQYPSEIQCPTGHVASSTVDLSSIMSKVRLEALMWGAGTAIGELPPFLMARAARLSGQRNLEQSSSWLQEKVEVLIKRVGFFGIIAFSSIPNPLFDLTGITCGYSLMPFWTFFGATLIGKAIIKVHLQKIFVIVAFSDKHFEDLLACLRDLPVLGAKLAFYFEEFLQKQKNSLHVSPGSPMAQVTSSSPVLSKILEWIVTATILYFLSTIINSLAQRNFIRSQGTQCKEGAKKKIR